MNIQTLIDQLNTESKILKNEHSHEHHEFQPGETMELAAYVLETLRGHVDELLPYMLDDLQQGLRIGPPPDGHDNDNCPDCQWYNRSINLLGRINQGEFNYSSD